MRDYLTDMTHPKPALHYSDPVFVKISTAHPMQEIRGAGKQFIRYRVFDQENEGEAIIFLPGMFETCSSSLYLLDQIAQRGYRCYSVELVGYDTYSDYVRGLCKFCRREKLHKLHLIGSDVGGFDAIEFASFPYLGSDLAIMSVTLINSFREPKMWEVAPIKLKVFGRLLMKSFLMDKIQESGALDQGLRAAVFCMKEIDQTDSFSLITRLKRLSSSRFPIAPALESDRILSIEPSDRAMSIPEEVIPSHAMSNITVQELAKGGDWPHIEVSSAVADLIVAHLEKCAVDVPLIQGEGEGQE